VELVERSDQSLSDLIDRMKSTQKNSSREQLALYKRSTLPLAVPFLAALGLPLGARRARPALVAVSVVLSWWAVMRICDQAVPTLGPLMAAGLPTLLVALAAAISWLSWSDA
jgi:lipopolysaccharide export LptBFGC system permease protein LptF